MVTNHKQNTEPFICLKPDQENTLKNKNSHHMNVFVTTVSLPFQSHKGMANEVIDFRGESSSVVSINNCNY